MKILVTGCEGNLGPEIRKKLHLGYSELKQTPVSLINTDVIGDDFDKPDHSNLTDIMTFVVDLRQNIIVNCAAYSNLGDCDFYRDTYFLANAIGLRNLALVTHAVGTKPVYLSKYYVYYGRDNGSIPRGESDIPNPMLEYSSTKMRGEWYVSCICSHHSILPNALLYSYFGKNSVKTMAQLATSPPYFEVMNDQFSNHPIAVDLFHERLKTATNEKNGFYRFIREWISFWFDFACTIIKNTGKEIEINPILSLEYRLKFPWSANRLAFSAFDNGMLRCSIGN